MILFFHAFEVLVLIELSTNSTNIFQRVFHFYQSNWLNEVFYYTKHIDNPLIILIMFLSEKASSIIWNLLPYIRMMTYSVLFVNRIY